MIDRNAFEDLIDKVVILDNCTDPDDLERKIELLCFALEELKHARGGDTEKVCFEEYVQSEVRLRNHKLIISAPQGKSGMLGQERVRFNCKRLCCCFCS